ncbi:YbaN family protein [Pseudoalteromonas sp. MMG010]|uniref:YbaN family protein n=1 Tax=Pseudoalteromonas sp. MMG010 TaxID=2822685 RepID=UPI001B3A1802|nr:YbaN family protein [Pseudoalteromonas sp. MMG010]MBQ4834054.1 YbaN family protein [Pseudoalteromonas sp. MMG010]
MKIKQTLVRYKNISLKMLGLLLVALGIIGIFLPVMPTTIFFILALACFTRSSPALAHWLLTHPRYGSPLQHWQKYRIVPIKAKVYAAIGMLIGFIFLLYSSAPIWVIGCVALIEITVLIYLILRPSIIPTS